MKQFKTVFNFEFMTLFRNKALIITTVILTLLSFVITSIPTIQTFFKSDETPDVEVQGNLFEGLGFMIDFENNEVYLDAFGIEKSDLYQSVDALKKDLDEGIISKGFFIKNDTNYDMYVNDVSAFSFEQELVEETLKTIKSNRLLEEKGIDVNYVYEALNVEITSNVISTGKDASQGMFISFAILFVLYMLILLYGTNVSTSVAREKDSRTMELLITSTKPKTLILGKVMATGLIGILQVALILFGLVLGVYLSRANYPEFLLAMIGGNLGWDVIVVYVLFSLFGYMLYLFIYAALGSLVSKVEDVNKAVAPITYVFIAAYMIASFAMQMPDAKIVAVSSYIPFVSLFTMPIRFMLTTVSWFSVFSSLVIMLISTVLLAALSIYIYRFGSLNYGNKIKFKQIVRSFKK